MEPVSRRRFLFLAAGGAVGLASRGNWPGGGRSGANNRHWPIVTRQTFALGSEVSITARHPSPEAAERAIFAAFDELVLVERLMSIYRPDSQVSTLNRDGFLWQPHPYLVEVLRHAERISHQTNGALDVTVQPLWEVFAAAAKEQRIPEERLVAIARAHVDWRGVAVDDNCVRLRRPGMKITLNGIAQGFAADRVLTALRERGIEHALINAGELQPLGQSVRGAAWKIGIQHPRQSDAYVALADLDGRALATSGDYATRFSADGQHHHIFDPRTGYSPTELCSVTIVAPSGMAADALSTACFVLGLESSLALIKTMPGVDAFFVLRSGETVATSGFPFSSERGAA